MSGLAMRISAGLPILFAAMAALVFGVAGTLHYPQAWIFFAIYFSASLAIVVYL